MDSIIEAYQSIQRGFYNYCNKYLIYFGGKIVCFWISMMEIVLSVFLRVLQSIKNFRTNE